MPGINRSQDNGVCWTCHTKDTLRTMSHTSQVPSYKDVGDFGMAKRNRSNIVCAYTDICQCVVVWYLGCAEWGVDSVSAYATCRSPQSLDGTCGFDWAAHSHGDAAVIARGTPGWHSIPTQVSLLLPSGVFPTPFLCADQPGAPGLHAVMGKAVLYSGKRNLFLPAAYKTSPRSLRPNKTVNTSSYILFSHTLFQVHCMGFPV